ncbi:hypothetical protein [Bradyrhizobium sp. CCGUVB14]|uniref:hypothetical protein n=1 Tax=Bradyrhizobium sp. CCGUVB14 TaxID=2949628 RepID=UPI0020B394B1|nr:hypothetical protein [Bradyrhizobium sp. CCGUVB14]MCP3443602.1 hypothetical protein [Bradyrhizobium sp. CCGUVB14]
MTIGQGMASLRQQIGQMGLAAPKSTAWKVTAALASLPILIFVIGPVLTAWLSDAPPNFREAVHYLAGFVLILSPTWIALFLNHPCVLFIFLLNFLAFITSLLCLAGIPVNSWVGLDGQAWWSILGTPVALIWSLNNSKRPDAAALDHSAPPIASLTTIST